MIVPETAVREIPLTKLKPSPANVRKTAADAGIEELAASIAAHGLLQMPVVAPELNADGAETGCYLVTAGERRRKALLLLVKQKKLKKAAPVTCLVRTDGNAEELTKPRPDQNGQEFPIESIFVALWITFFVGAFAMTILVPIFGKKIGRNRYRWLGMDFTIGGGSSGGSSSGGGWSSGGGSWSSGGGGFSGGGGSSGGGGASGGW